MTLDRGSSGRWSEMLIKAVMWNVEEVGCRERELRALIKKYEPDVLVLSELKSTDLNQV